MRGHQAPPSQLCVIDPRGLPQPAVRAEVGYPVYPAWGGYLVGSPPPAPLLSVPIYPVLQAPGSAMARARQEGSSPEPVEGLSATPAPLPARPPGCPRRCPAASANPASPAAPAAPALLPAAYSLRLPTAPPAVTAALGAPAGLGVPAAGPEARDPTVSACPAPEMPGAGKRETPRNPGKGSESGRGMSAGWATGGCG